MRTLPRRTCQTYHQHTPSSYRQGHCCTLHSYDSPSFEPNSSETLSCCCDRDCIMANKTSPNTTLLCLYTTPSEANENIEYSERMSEVIPVNYMIWKLGFKQIRENGHYTTQKARITRWHCSSRCRRYFVSSLNHWKLSLLNEVGWNDTPILPGCKPILCKRV